MRVLTFTSLFPNPAQPDFGGFVARRMESWAARFASRWAVVAPVPFFPPLPWRTRWSIFARIPRREQRRSWTVLHPGYFMLPGVGGYFQGISMARGAAGGVERLWREQGPFDLVDAHYVYPDGYAALRLARRLGVPVVVSARGTDVNLYSTLPGIAPRVRTVLRQADALIAVSEALRERMVGVGAAPDRCHVVRNGVDLERFRPAIRRESPRSRLLTVGNLVPGKGVDTVLKALALLSRRGVEAELWVAGEGPERASLEGLAAKLHISERVRFLGRVPHGEMPSVYAEADLFCLASRAEGCPNVVLEALASGLPVVATPVGGVPELVRNGENGVLASGAEPGAFAEALRRGLDGRWDPQRIRAGVEKSSWGQTAERVQEVFEKVRGSRVTHGGPAIGEASG